MENKPSQSEPWPSIEADVQGFFDTHLHIGFRVPFVLDYLEENTMMKVLNPQLSTYQTILKNVDDEDLPEIDREFNAGLQNVGSRWEAVLRIPYWYYEK